MSSAWHSSNIEFAISDCVGNVYSDPSSDMTLDNKVPELIVPIITVVSEEFGVDIDDA